MMKRIQFLIQLLFFAILLSSCEKEGITNESEVQNASVIDSSQFPHNLVWNGHYYLLEFQEAHADLGTDAWYGIVDGGGPSTLWFCSTYKDKYTNKLLAINLSIGQVGWSDTNYEMYVYENVQDELETAYGVMDEVNNYYRGLIITSTIFPTYNILKTQTNMIISIDNYHTYFIGQDKWADYHLIIHSDELALDLNGKFKAQHQ